MRTLWALNTLLAESLILADQGRVMQMGRRFRPGGSNFDLKDFMLLLTFFALVILVVWGLSRFFTLREERGYLSQRGLFRELCRAHKLDWTSRRLLWHLARWHRLERPGDLFTRPECFETADLAGPLAEHRDRLVWLRDRLFYEQSDG